MNEKGNKYFSRFLRSAGNTLGKGVEKADDLIDDGIKHGTKLSKQVKEKSETIYDKSSQKISNIKSDNKTEKIELLEKLANLKKQGIITDEEFEQKKKEILDSI